MFADRDAPLNAFARPFPRDLEQPFGQANARRRQRQPPGVQRRKRDFESGAFFENDVLPRDAHVRELHDCVVKRAQSHEPAAINDLQSRRIDIDNKCRDLFALFPSYHLRRCARHYYQHAGFHTVGAPKLFAV